ncbi:MAG TPA: GGDEF domain-containing protein [Gammaproteobacteria bacterium]|nr:GGDEF domain-containing protein [Gammaproteobacteria bacterium]
MALQGIPNTAGHRPEQASNEPQELAPAVPRLTAALQTTLELEEMLAIFQRETGAWLPVDGILFQGPERAECLEIGNLGRHRCSYTLELVGQPLGELTFTRNRRFSEEEMKELERLLCALLFPLRNALQYRSALEAAFRDPLTGAENRAALEKGLVQELSLARRHGVPLSLVTLDIDSFKRVNDRYGHVIGDCVLQAVAEQTRTALRESDLFYRYGGEEFVILLPHTGLDGARRVAERVCRQVADHICCCDRSHLQVTVSLGVAAYTGESSGMILFDRADRAMYRAKGAGGNRVMVSEHEETEEA